MLNGAGVNSVNGTYNAIGYYNGALLFRHEDEEEGVVHFLYCAAPRKPISQSSLWVLVSSTNFPDQDNDILFYTCSSTFMKGALPSSTGWEACPRQSEGLTELMMPAPQTCGLSRTPGCIDLLATGMINAEIHEDDRVSMLVEALSAKVEESALCRSWVQSGNCAGRFRTCRFSHAFAARGYPLGHRCNHFSSDKGCHKTAYECERLHAWGDRKIKLRVDLLKSVPTLLVPDNKKNRPSLLF